jgi:hypothetical protein
MAVLAWASIACACTAMPARATPAPPTPTPPTPTTGPDVPTVVATWIAEDGSVVVLNVVVPLGTRPHELPGLGHDLRRRHPESRVIVNVFAARAGPERFVIGRAPSGDEPRLPEERPSTLLATYDFPRRAGR